MQVIVQELVTSYERCGTGRQVLILYGWADNARNWQPFASELSKFYDVITPDLPGFGGSEAPHDDWGLADYAGFLADFITKLNLRPYAVIAHSNGGAIALKGLGLQLFAAKKLVLLASAGIRDEGMGRKRALKYLAKTGKAVTMPLPASYRSKLRGNLYRAAGSDMLIAEHMQETFKRVVGEDVRGDAAQISIPSLLVYGSSDTSTPTRYGELLADGMGDAKLEVIPGAGHFIYSESQNQVIQMLKEFIG